MANTRKLKAPVYVGDPDEAKPVPVVPPRPTEPVKTAPVLEPRELTVQDLPKLARVLEALGTEALTEFYEIQRDIVADGGKVGNEIFIPIIVKFIKSYTEEAQEELIQFLSDIYSLPVATIKRMPINSYVDLIKNLLVGAGAFDFLASTLR